MKRIIQLLPFLFLCTFLSAQEICDNGIDDDGDNLVDLNDSEDCNCFTDVPSSLIPNPSFEEMTCCPEGEGQLECAVGWEQASGPTTDYVHECGVLGNEFIGKIAPLPFPDGLGAIGFRDGKPGRPNFKEYAGACLTSPMELGKLYRLDFFVGFPDDVASNIFDMSLYGTKDCTNLPFGGGAQDPGCPTNFPDWELIGRQTVGGNNEWLNVVFEFSAEENYEAIVLGPSCDPHPNFNSDPYFFFDRLLLAEREQFGLPFSEITGSVCSDGLNISVDIPDALSYQWYLNGVALLGYDQQQITLSEILFPEGQYQVVIQTPDGCFISQTYQMEIPVYEEELNIELCQGDTIIFGNQVITEANQYTESFLADDGCDSIVTLMVDVFLIEEDFDVNICEGDTLLLGNQIITEGDTYIETLKTEESCDSLVTLRVEVLRHSSSGLADTICEGDLYSIDGFDFEEQGIFDYTIPNTDGCDSLITLDLTVIPANDGVEISEDLIEIKLGELVNISPSFVDPRLDNFTWTDEDGNIISQGEILSGYQPTNSTTVQFSAADEYGCPSIDIVEIRVSKDVTTYIPNVFTPDDENINNIFTIHPTAAVSQISEINIYDRWGELVFTDTNTGPVETFAGWDGRFNGVDAMAGVYVYIVTVDLIDGNQEVYTGDITLIR